MGGLEPRTLERSEPGRVSSLPLSPLSDNLIQGRGTRANILPHLISQKAPFLSFPRWPGLVLRGKTFASPCFCWSPAPHKAPIKPPFPPSLAKRKREKLANLPPSLAALLLPLRAICDMAPPLSLLPSRDLAMAVCCVLFRAFARKVKQ